MKQNARGGFSLMEALIYIAIFAVSAVFLVSILTVVTRVQLKQSSSHEVEQQIAFVNNTIRDFVQRSSLIDMDEVGVPTTTLRLRTASSSSARVLVYASSSILYLEEQPYDENTGLYGTSRITPLTDSNTQVDSFYVTKFENPGGFAVAQIDLALSANTASPEGQVTRTLQTAVTRISAATFDSSIKPGATQTFDLGSTDYKWNNAFFSGTVDMSGTLSVSGALVTKGSGNGVVVKDANNANCYKIYTYNGVVTSTLSSGCQ